MTIQGISGANAVAGQLGMGPMGDSFSQNIQRQIANAQKELQELSSKEDMTPEEKMKKRQEIQQQISDLNAQLRQHQMEERAKKQQKQGDSMDDLLGGGKNAKSAGAKGRGTGLSTGSMAAIISADGSMKLAQEQGRMATQMEGEANVLKREIATDESLGVDTTAKRQQLAETEQNIDKTRNSQMGSLADANQAIEEAQEAESTETKGKEDASAKKAGEKKSKNPAQTDKAGETSNGKVDGANGQAQAVDGSTGPIPGAGEGASGGTGTAGATETAESAESAGAAETGSPQESQIAYRPIDVRL